EVVNHPVAVEAEIVGIGAHETDDIGGARQIAAAALFDRLQVADLDVGLARDGVDVLLQLGPAVAQHGADVGQTAASTSVRFGSTAVHHPLNLAGPAPAGAPCATEAAEPVAVP